MKGERNKVNAISETLMHDLTLLIIDYSDSIPPPPPFFPVFSVPFLFFIPSTMLFLQSCFNTKCTILALKLLAAYKLYITAAIRTHEMREKKQKRWAYFLCTVEVGITYYPLWTNHKLSLQCPTINQGVVFHPLPSPYSTSSSITMCVRTVISEGEWIREKE